MVLALWLEARGGLRGLYLRCSLDGPPCKALVDTGSTISLLRLRFSGHHRRSLGGMVVDQRPPDVCDGAGDWNEGEKRRVGDQEVMHEFWLADIRDRCIIGLDLLTHWGARGDVAGAGHHYGCGDGGTPVPAGKERSPSYQSRIVRLRHEGAWLPPGPCIPSGPVSAAFPSRKTAEAVHALWLHSGV